MAAEPGPEHRRDDPAATPAGSTRSDTATDGVGLIGALLVGGGVRIETRDDSGRLRLRSLVQIDADWMLQVEADPPPTPALVAEHLRAVAGLKARIRGLHRAVASGTLLASGVPLAGGGYALYLEYQHLTTLVQSGSTFTADGLGAGAAGALAAGLVWLGRGLARRLPRALFRLLHWWGRVHAGHVFRRRDAAGPGSDGA